MATSSSVTIMTKEMMQGRAGTGRRSERFDSASSKRRLERRSNRPRLRKPLVIDSNAERNASLIEALRSSGFRPSAAQGVLHALTMLEWQRPDLIIIRSGEDDDMSPRDFCRTVKQDPLFKKVPIARVADPLSGPGSPEPFDLVFEDGDAEEVAKQACNLRWRGLEGARDDAGGGNKEVAAADPASGLDRLLGLLSDMERAIWTGRLLFELEGQLSSPVLLIDNGQVVHAEFDRLLGAAALDRILAVASQTRELNYRCDEITRWNLTAYPRTIRRGERQRSIRSALEASSDSAQRPAPERPGVP